MNIGEAISTALEFISKSLMINAEYVEKCCMKVMYVDTLFFDVVSIITGFPVTDAGLNAAASYP